MAGKQKNKVGEDIKDDISKDSTNNNMMDNDMTDEGNTDEPTKAEDEEQQEPPPTDARLLADEPNDEDEPEEMWDFIETLQGKHKLVCRMEKCKRKAVAVWKSSIETDTFPICEPCQEQEFDGWPEDTETPVDTETGAPTDSKMTTDETKGAIEPEADDDQEPNENDDESAETWDLQKVYSVQALNDACPIKCSHDDCKLQAAVTYVSSTSGVKWHSCLDCQDDDYGGWPERDEIPISYMSQEHKDLMVAKCSKFKTTDMPVFPNTSPVKTATPGNTVTPVPNSNPHSQKHEKDGGGGAVITPMENTKKSIKPSKQNLAMHAKWREAAVAAGGPDAQIVIKHSAAKKLIFEYLYDAFHPETISQIYQGLKAVVPSPVLKACLDAMALNDASQQFIDSDDEDSGKKKKKKDKPEESDADDFQNSLGFKAGKGNNSLYYVDYNKAKNGNGLEGDEKNEFLSQVAKAEAQAEALTSSLKNLTATTTKLLSEPLNEEVTLLLQKGEAELDNLNEQLESARKLAVNEKHKQNLKRRIDNMANIWRQRKRTCMEFLGSLEEITDGSITAKKCFNGDGPKGMELESDEAISSAAVEYHKTKNTKTPGGKKRLVASKTVRPQKQGIQPTESFVAVLLSSQGRVERVYADDDAN